MTEPLEQLKAALADRYRLDRELGRGGMATVYLAHDFKHDRSVALKVLHPDLAAALGPERFEREIKLAARLQHPHILTVLDSGEAGDGSARRLWFTMPYVEGESLRDRLRRERQLSIAEAARITVEAGQALHYAHEHGVLHRDIKPENILLTSDGNTLVADFGVARALGPEASLMQTGMTVGTPAYMSPEQAAGERDLDCRSDVYALGCVLYEMLAGEPPFTGPTAQAIIAKRFNTAVTPLRIVRPDVPESVDLATLRALARTPADRFASAAELAAALQNPTPAAGSVATSITAASGRRRTRLVAAVALVALVLAGTGWLGYRASRRNAPVKPDASALAVLPFRVVGPGLDLWREGMVDLLSLDLDGAAGLRAIQPRTVLSHWHRELGNEAGSADQAQTLAVARATGASYALTGSIVGQGSSVRLIAELVDVATGRTEGQAQVEGTADSVPALIDRLAIELLQGGFGDRSGARIAADVGSVTTRSLPALKTYLTGVQAFRHAQPQAAATAFRAAIQDDSGFALATYHLAIAEGWTGSPHNLGTGFATLRQAFQHADRLPRRERQTVAALMLASNGDVASIPMLRAITAKYPDDPESWYLLGDALFHLGGAALEPAESFRRALERATELDSTFAPPYLHLAEDAFDRLDSVTARRVATALRRIEPASAKTTGLNIAYALAWGTPAERKEARAALDTATAFAVLTAKHATNLNPDLWEQTLLVGHALADQSRHPASERSQGMHGIAIVYEIRGRIKDAMTQWRRTDVFNGATAVDLKTRDHTWYLMRILGLPYDSAAARRSYAWVRDSVGDGWTTLLGGLYAASHGLGADTERWLQRYDSLTRHDLETGDSAGARRGEESKRVIRAFLAESRGDTGAVLRELRQGIAVYPGPAGTESLSGQMLRFVLVQRLVAAKDYATAQRFFGTFERWGTMPDYAAGPIELLRGQAGEGLGDVDGARTHYANLVRWWKDCDSDLVPVREEARRALVNLEEHT